MKNRLSVIVPLILLFSSACSSIVTQTPTTTIARTSFDTVTSTYTPTTKPTSTPTIELTITPTETPILTNTLTPEPTPEPTEEPQPSPEPVKPLSEITNLDHIPERTVKCVDPRLCYHMDVKEEQREAAWRQVISSFAVSPMLQDYWKDLGVEDPNSESVEAFLASNVGGPENSAYWLPAESPNGIPFMMLQGRHGESGEFVENMYIKENGGVSLGKVGFVAFSLSEWGNTESEEHEWFNELLKNNYRLKGATLHDAGRDGNPYSLYGPLLFDNHFVFTIGSKKSADFDTAWNTQLEAKETTQLGGIQETFRPDFDPKIAQAYWETYWEYTKEWWQTADDWSYKNLNIGIFKWPGGNPKVNILNVNETIFEPIE